MTALTPMRKVAYFVFGLPALFFTILAPVSIYAGAWAYLNGSDTSTYSVIHFVIAPLCGAIATVSALILIASRGQPSERSRVSHTIFLCGGIATAVSLAGPTVGLLFSLLVLSPALVALLLLRHLWWNPR